MANPYYVEPRMDVSQGLSGLASVIDRVGERRRLREEQEAAQEAARQAQIDAQTVFASGDPQAIADLVIRRPELRESIESAMGIRNDAQRRDQLRFLTEVNSNPQRAPEVFERTITMMEARGEDASRYREMYQDFMADPETEARNLEGLFAAEFTDEWKAWREARQGSSGANAVTDIGKLRQDLEAGFITQAQYDAAVGSAMLPGEADQRDRKIADYMSQFGMSRRDAIRAVDSDLRQDPTSGVLTLFDPTTSQANVVDIQTGAPSEVLPSAPSAQIDMLNFDPGKGTGFVSALAGLWNSTLGQTIFLPILGEGREQSAQQLRVLERDAISALASSSRPPVVEQERILSMMPKAMEWLENPEVARLKMTGFLDLMMQQYGDDLRYQRDLTKPRELREESAERASRIESIVRRTMTPEAAQTMLGSFTRIQQEVGEIDRLSDSELLSLDPANLSDAQFEYYMQRLQGMSADAN